jgi:hypothetical protein
LKVILITDDQGCRKLSKKSRLNKKPIPMKKLSLIICLLAVSTLMFTIVLFGCSKKSGEEEETSQFYFKAKVDGKIIESKTVTGSYSKNPNHLSLYGRLANPDQQGGFDIEIFPFAGVGTYLMKVQTIDNTLGVLRINKEPLANYVYSSNVKGCSGKVVITSYDNGIIKGTFEFTAASKTSEKKSVTEGSFEIKVESTD